MAVSRDMWRLVHAAAVGEIHTSARKYRITRDSVKPYTTTPMEMLKNVQRSLQRMVTTAWITRGQGAQLPWKLWRSERWIHGTRDRVSVQVLRRGYERPEGWQVDVEGAVRTHLDDAARWREEQAAALAGQATRREQQEEHAARTADTGQHDADAGAPSGSADPAHGASEQRDRTRDDNAELRLRQPGTHPHLSLRQDLQDDDAGANGGAQHARHRVRGAADEMRNDGSGISDVAAPELGSRRTEVRSRPQQEQTPAKPVYKIYTDGAWNPPDEEDFDGIFEAGYGVAEFETCGAQQQGAFPMDQLVRRRTRVAENDGGNQSSFGKLTWAESAQVVTKPTAPGYAGATAHTNNTGELSALREAICRTLCRPRGTGREEIWTDSLYAMNMATGRWRPKCKRNRGMIERLRELWRRLQRERPHEVHILHVRSHVKVPGNELADWLADTGRRGGGVGRAAAERWLAGWLRRMRGGEGRDEPG